MTKESAAWLAIRIIGLVPFGETLLLLVNVATELVALQKFYGVVDPAAANIERYIIQSWVTAAYTLRRLHSLQGCPYTFFARVTRYIGC